MYISTPSVCLYDVERDSFALLFSHLCNFIYFPLFFKCTLIWHILESYILNCICILVVLANILICVTGQIAGTLVRFGSSGEST